MDVPTNTLKPFVPRWGTPDEWNEAYEKVENYLRACRINSRLHRAQLIYRILERVASRSPLADGTTLSRAAIRETQMMLDSWCQRLMQTGSKATAFSPVDGRVALLLCDGPDRWPDAFLADGELPADLVREMRASMLVAGPNLEISNMVPRPIDFGWFPEIAGDTLQRLERRPLLKAFFYWGIFVLVLAYLFYRTRR